MSQRESDVHGVRFVAWDGTQLEFPHPGPGVAPYVIHFGSFAVMVGHEGHVLVLPPWYLDTVKGMTGDQDRLIAGWRKRGDDRGEGISDENYRKLRCLMSPATTATLALLWILSLLITYGAAYYAGRDA